MNNLALKYRPKTFNELVAQDAVKEILQFQATTKQIKNSYLFVGASGCGKTTSARIFANLINDGKGSPIEIDAASNTGVDNVREIIAQARFRSLDSEYKVYIIDEAHMLSIGAWNALLKLLEEPPTYTIFILCTTEPHKVPTTILSRVQRFDFTKIPQDIIVDRLQYIIEQECLEMPEGQQIEVVGNALQIIAENANGNLRTAISLLDKCLDYSIVLGEQEVCSCLGIQSNANLYNFTDYIFNKNKLNVIKYIENVYNNGADIKQFIKQYISYLLQMYKQVLLGEIKSSYNLLELIDCLLNINNEIKYDDNPRTIVLCELLLFMEKI